VNATTGQQAAPQVRANQDRIRATLDGHSHLGSPDYLPISFMFDATSIRVGGTGGGRRAYGVPIEVFASTAALCNSAAAPA